MQPGTLSTLAVSGYVRPPPLISGGRAFGRQNLENDRIALLATLTSALAEARAELKEQSDRFGELYRQADQLGVSYRELENLADELLARERGMAEKLVPQIASFNGHLEKLEKLRDTPFRRSLRRIAEEAVDMSASWLELYQNLRIRLLKLASDRQSIEHLGSGMLSTDQEVDDYLRGLTAQ
jgi:chromosome segregation ATPase